MIWDFEAYLAELILSSSNPKAFARELLAYLLMKNRSYDELSGKSYFRDET